MTDKKAGEKRADGTYPKDTINDLVDRKLTGLAEGLKKFGEEEDKETKKSGRGKTGK